MDDYKKAQEVEQEIVKLISDHLKRVEEAGGPVHEDKHIKDYIYEAFTEIRQDERRSKEKDALFWVNVERPKTKAGCWEWDGTIKDNGYGQYIQDNKYWYAHVYAYQLCNGPLDEDKQVHHKCGNRKCVNPRHLEQLTQQEHSALHKDDRKTCNQGHPWSENTGIRPGNGARYCKACRDLANARRPKKREMIAKAIEYQGGGE